MAVRGTKPKPTKLRLITGNAGKRAMPTNEPPAEGRPKSPVPLTGRAAALWRRYIAPAAWLSHADSPKAWLWVNLQAEAEADLSAMTAARIGQLRALGSELGMDPSARARMGTPAKPTDLTDKYFS